MKEHEHRLKALLTGQQFDEYEAESEILERAKNALRLILWQQTALQSYQISNKTSAIFILAS